MKVGLINKHNYKLLIFLYILLFHILPAPIYVLTTLFNIDPRLILAIYVGYLILALIILILYLFISRSVIRKNLEKNPNHYGREDIPQARRVPPGPLQNTGTPLGNSSDISAKLNKLTIMDKDKIRYDIFNLDEATNLKKLQEIYGFTAYEAKSLYNDPEKYL